MDFKILDFYEKDLFERDIIKMLTDSDAEFVPPLSKRTGTLDKKFSDCQNTPNGVLAYYLQMKEQKILAAFEKGKIIGIISFREDFISEEIDSSELPNIYVSTLVITHSSRGKGLTKRMYSYLFSELYPHKKVFTRTWSTNFAHTKILSDFGFEEIKRNKNDRGNGIDSVYYKKEREKMPISVL